MRNKLTKTSTTLFLLLILLVSLISAKENATIQDPHNSDNYIALGLDVAGAALPFATGLGAGFKLAKNADKVSGVADVAKLADNAGDAAKQGDKADDFLKWLTKGPEDVSVYKGFDSTGKEVYTGITNDISRRQSQHGDRFNKLNPVTDSLTRNQARSVEQNLIEKGTNYQNKINSMSKKNQFYDRAKNWVSKFFKGGDK